MAAATPIAAAPDPIKNLLDILGTFGSGKTTTTTGSESSDAATQQMQDLIKEISNSSSPEALSTLVQGILAKAKESFGPNIAASIGAGNRTSSDSSLALLQGNAAARATADSAAAVLEARNNANKLATQLTDTRLQTSRKTTSTQQTGISPAGKGLLGLGAISQIKKALSKGGSGGGGSSKGDSSKKPEDTNKPEEANTPEQLGLSPEELATMQGPEQLGFSQDQLNSLSNSAEFSSSILDVIPNTGPIIDNPFVGSFPGDTLPADPNAPVNPDIPANPDIPPPEPLPLPAPQEPGPPPESAPPPSFGEEITMEDIYAD